MGRAIVLLILAAVLTGVAACGTDPGEPNVREFAARVDSLQVPATINRRASLVVGMRWEAGGCRRFKRIDAFHGDTVLTITVIAEDSVRAACPEDLRKEWVYHTAPPLPRSPYEVSVRRPAADPLRAIVRYE